MRKRKKKHRGKERCGWDQILGGWPRPSRFCCRCPSSAALIELGRSGWRFSRAFSLRNITYNTPRPHPPHDFFTTTTTKENSDKSDRPSTRHHLQSPCIARFERTNEPWRFSPISAYERKFFSVGFWLFFFGIYASYPAFPFKLSRSVLVCILAGLCIFSSPLFLFRGWSKFFFVIIYIHKSAAGFFFSAAVCIFWVGKKNQKKSLKSCLIIFFRRGGFEFDFYWFDS